jgi:hypothetical protein
VVSSTRSVEAGDPIDHVRTRKVSAATLTFAAIVTGYCILGLFVLAPEGVYSGDIGVKYVQARALAAQRFASLNIPYPGEVLDPSREFFPIVPPFVMTTGGTTQAIFSPIAAVVQAGAATIAGIRGLVAVSILAAAIALYAACRLVPEELRLPLVVTLGIGSPLWFYAVSGWEHAPAIALATAAFAIASKWRSPRAIAAAGLLLGAGATLRDEVLLLAPGLLFVSWLRERATRPASALAITVVAVLTPLVLSALVEVVWFERPAAAHLRHAVHIVQVAAGVTNEPNPDVPALEPFTLRDRYETVVNYWLAGSGNNRAIAAFAVSFGIALLLRARFGTSAGLLAVSAAVGAIAVADAYEVLTAPKWLAGFVRVAPYILLAFFPAPRGGSKYGWLPSAIAFTAVTYLVVAFIGADTNGGKSLGPRLLMPLLPLLAVAAVLRIAEYARSGTIERGVAAAGAALIVLAVIFHTLSAIPAYYDRNQDDAKAVLMAAAAPERIVVADDPFTAQLLFPLYYRKIILLAETADAGARLGQVLSDQRTISVLVASRDPGPLTLPPLRFESSYLAGRMVIQRWRRQY